MYEFTARPMCTVEKPDCNSKWVKVWPTVRFRYLFCAVHAEQARCMSKVNVGGECRGFEDQGICWHSECVKHECRAASPKNSSSPSATGILQKAAAKFFARAVIPKIKTEKERFVNITDLSSKKHARFVGKGDLEEVRELFMRK